MMLAMVSHVYAQAAGGSQGFMQTQANVQQTILAWLDQNGIAYRVYTHEPAYTIDACLELPFIQEHVTICKNVFLTNRQQTDYFLMLLRPQTPFRTAVVSKALGTSRLSFAPEAALHSLLHLSSGSVSPLGLYFDQSHRIQLCYEAAVRDSMEIAFHPCDNAATVIFEQAVFWEQVLPLLGVQPIAIKDVTANGS